MNLKNKKIGIIIYPGFDDSQVTGLFKLLKGVGADIGFICQDEELPEFITGRDGTRATPNVRLLDVCAEKLDAIIIPSADHVAKLCKDETVLILLLEMQYQNKPIGSIYNGIYVLSAAGILPGRRVTGNPDIKKDAEDVGAKFLDQPVVVDNNMVTAQDTADLSHFLEAIAFLLEPATTSSQ